MNRRNLLKLALSGSAAAQSLAPDAPFRPPKACLRPRSKTSHVIETQPAGVRLTVVKITTDQDGLYGYGCATFTQRADLVKPAVESYLKPFLVGKTTDRIEDIWQSCYDSSYWKNGPVLNNAISGVDQALWDIKGRQAGLPVYDLVGGKTREAADCYGHADGSETRAGHRQHPQVVPAQGFRHVRAQVGRARLGGLWQPEAAAKWRQSTVFMPGPVFEPAYYTRRVLKMFDASAASSWLRSGTAA